MYKCVCSFECKSSNELKRHKESCDVLKKIVENSPICVCGERLGYYMHNGVITFQKNCGKHRCRSLYAKKIFTGRKWTEEHKRNHTKTKFKEVIYKEGIFTCERCRKIFNSNTELRAHKASCGYLGEYFCDVCGKIFKKKSGLSTHKLARHDTSAHSKEYRSKMSNVGKNVQKFLRNNYMRKSSVEVEFKNNFLKNIEAKEQFHLKNRNNNYYYDFYIRKYNLLIEVDGDYWHINPKFYEINQMSPYIQEYKRYEKEKEDHAKSLGYNIIRFWEDDIYNNIDYVKGELNKWLR